MTRQPGKGFRALARVLSGRNPQVAGIEGYGAGAPYVRQPSSDDKWRAIAHEIKVGTQPTYIGGDWLPGLDQAMADAGIDEMVTPYGLCRRVGVTPSKAPQQPDHYQPLPLSSPFPGTSPRAAPLRLATAALLATASVYLMWKASRLSVSARNKRSTPLRWSFPTVSFPEDLRDPRVESSGNGAAA